MNFFEPICSIKNSKIAGSLIDFARSGSIPPASSKIASDARSGAIEKIGGLLICQPSADGTGMNSGSRCMRNRVFGSLPNQPARRGNSCVGRVTLMHKRARHRAGAGVQIFV